MKGATHQRTHDLVTGRKIKTNNNITNGHTKIIESSLDCHREVLHTIAGLLFLIT